ncbi:MAG TPA: hypothetical protein DIT89_09305 [Planctomycetaceae bacterium]|nr:hypothetical protein [Planctomycetaceae bacterium]
MRVCPDGRILILKLKKKVLQRGGPASLGQSEGIQDVLRQFSEFPGKWGFDEKRPQVTAKKTALPEVK